MSLASLHPRLAQGCSPIIETPHYRLLLKDNAHFVWLIVVPKVAENVQHLHQLPAEISTKLGELTLAISRIAIEELGFEKLNSACIGNQVPQLHLHFVMRRSGDICWPQSVWAPGTPRLEYEQSAKQACIDKLKALFAACGIA